MRQREHLCRVCERHWALSRRVKGVVDVYERGDQSKMSLVVLRDEETQACRKERPAHVWEGKQEQSATSISIDRPYGGPGREISSAMRQLVALARPYHANRKLMAPNPQEASRAPVTDAPALANTVEE